MGAASRLLLLASLAGAGVGCASLIGASFDDATLAADASDALALPDTSEADGSVVPRSGLALWLDGTAQVDVSGSVVTRWHDLSGNARDAVPAGGGSQAPTASNGIHGLGTVHFAAESSQLLVAPWVGPGGFAMTVFVVANGYPQSAVRFQLNSLQAPCVIFPFDVATSSDAGPDFGFFISGEPFARVPVDRTRPQLLTARFEDGATFTYNDGQLAEQHLPGPASLPQGQTLYIGGALPLLAAPYTAPQFFGGDLGEILIYDTSLSDPDRGAIEAYLRNKWGI